MKQIAYLFAMVVIFIAASVAWVGFGGIMTSRTFDQQQGLYGNVADLWGTPQTQPAPKLEFHWQEEGFDLVQVYDKHGRTQRDENGDLLTKRKPKTIHLDRAERLHSTDVTANLSLDQRRKGLMWFSLYDVDFNGNWTYTHTGTEAGTLKIVFNLPQEAGVYDDFRFTLNDVEVSDTYEPSNGMVVVPVAVKPGDQVAFGVGYKSRGQDTWSYQPTEGRAGQLRDFHLNLQTDFASIDFPAFTLSPSAKARVGDGWSLDWDFRRLVTSHGMGMTLPTRIQPGPLAAAMSFSAPISLGLFMVWIYVLGLLKSIDIHPVNYAFIAASFFSFHLLFGYSADHLTVVNAFALSSVVSVFLTVTYLRLVVSARFALVEAGLAQLLYLVGFSLAHFWEGFTGLTVTVLGIVTLFALMQLTGRVKWSNVFSGAPTSPAPRPATAK